MAALVAALPVAATPALLLAPPAAPAPVDGAGRALPAAPSTRTALHLRGGLAQAGASVVNGGTATDTDTDSGTSTSSRAKLDIPAGATVKWARLYWGGSMSAPGPSAGPSASASPSGSPSVSPSDSASASPSDSASASPSASPAGADKNGSVRLALPAAAYKTITADPADVRVGPSGYQASADVTGLISSGGAGTYTVGDVAADTSRPGAYGGWTLLVAYSQPDAKPRDITVYDGFAPGQTAVLRPDADDDTAPAASPSGSPSGSPSASAPSSASAPGDAASGTESRLGVVAYGGDAGRSLRTRQENGSWSRAAATSSGYGTAQTQVKHTARHLRAGENASPGDGAPFAVDAGDCGCWPSVAYVQRETPVAPQDLAGATKDDASLAVTGVSTTPVRADGQAAYTVTVKNNGPAEAKDAEVSSELGSGLTYAEGPADTTAEGQAVTTQLGDVAAGTTATVTINVNVDVSAAASASSAGTSSVQSQTPALVPTAPLDCPPLRTGVQTGASTLPAPVTPAPSVSPQAQTSAPAPSPSQVQSRPQASGQASGQASAQASAQASGEAHVRTTVTVPVPAPQKPVLGVPVMPPCIVCATRQQETPVEALPSPSVAVTAAPPVVADTPTPTVTATVTRTQSPYPPPQEQSASASPSETPSQTPSETPSETPSQTPSATPNQGSATSTATPTPSPSETPTPSPTATPPHHKALPPPEKVVGPAKSKASETPTPTRTAHAAPPPAESPSPDEHAAPADRGAPRRDTGLGADVRHMLPFTGLPLALMAGAAGVLLIAGALAIRAARRRRATQE